jgi:hypothetical protein
MLQVLESYLKDHWLEFGHSSAVPNEITWLIQCRSRILVFAFDKKSRWPLAVAKISRDEETAQRTINEFHNLQAVRQRLSASWLDTVPYPVALEQVGKRTVEWERLLPGYSWPLAPSSFLARPQAEPIAQVYRWLVNFQSQCTYEVQVMDDDTLEAMLVVPVVSLLEHVGIPSLVQQRARGIARELRGLTIPRVHRHGDLHPTNLLFLGDRLQGVTDWEMATPDSWPFYDWLQFVFEYRLELARKQTPSLGREAILYHMVDALFNNRGSRQEETMCAWTIRFLANYGLSYEVAPLLWLHYASEVRWPEDKETFLSIMVPAVVRWARWDG